MQYTRDTRLRRWGPEKTRGTVSFFGNPCRIFHWFTSQSLMKGLSKKGQDSDGLSWTVDGVKPMVVMRGRLSLGDADATRKATTAEYIIVMC